MVEPASTATVIKEVVIPVAAEVYDLLKERGALDRVKDFLLRRRPHRVLMLGATGTGKTSLLLSMQGKDAFVRRENRTKRADSRTGRIKHKSADGAQSALFTFVDTPGEMEHKPVRDKAIREAAGDSPLGIINVVSHGYHEALAKTDDAIKNGSAVPAFLDERRQVELDLLAEWTGILAGEGGAAAWLLTVVTKADLWWTPQSHEQVIQYYSTGTYYHALGDAKRLRKDVVAYSAIRRCFYDSGPMSGYYSDEQQRLDRHALVGALLELASG